MNKVEIINLGGRAYRLDEPAYHALKEYLKRAEQALDGNPDKQEIIDDLERAIAERCNAYLHGAKDVITGAEMAKVVERMGPVVADGDEAGASKTEGSTKRLFAIPKNAMLAGVCQGIGAYFGVNANIIRALFIFATIVSGGLWILIYVLLALFLPQARTPEELAQAYNQPFTAQDIVEQVATRAPSAETVSNVINTGARLVRILAIVCQVLLALVIGILTAGLIVGIWGMWLGNFNLQGELANIPFYQRAAFITAAYLVAAIPVLVGLRLCGRLADWQSGVRKGVLVESLLAVLFGMAVVVMAGFAFNYHDSVRSYVNDHKGYFDIGKHHFCADQSVCGPSPTPDPPQLFDPGMN